MRTDLSGQIRELMERGLRPVTMADIEARPPVRVTLLQRAAAKSQLGHRRIMLAGAAAASVSLAVAATVIGVTYQGGHPLPPASKAAMQLLAKVADAAARQPIPRVRDSQYMYVETKEASWLSPGQVPPPLTNGSFPRHPRLKEPITSQTWVPVADVCRTGLERTTAPNGQASGAPFSAQGSGVKCPSIGSLNDATYRLLQTLPTDPQALLNLIYRVERGHGPGPTQEAFVTIGDLLNGKIPPPKVAAALYRAAALIPGVTLVPDATDAIGRHGVAVAQHVSGIPGGIVSELIFSKTTLRLIGSRTIEARTGASTSATAIISQAFVNHLGQVPRAGQDLASG
jgi:hypothetical protein